MVESGDMNDCEECLLACFLTLMRPVFELLWVLGVGVISILLSWGCGALINLIGGSLTPFQQTCSCVILTSLISLSAIPALRRKLMKSIFEPYYKTNRSLYTGLTTAMTYLLLGFVANLAFFFQFSKACPRPVWYQTNVNTTVEDKGHKGHRADPFLSRIQNGDGRRFIQVWTGLVGEGYTDEEQYSTTLFLLTLSWMTYSFMDKTRVRRIPGMASYFRNFIVTLGFMGLHLVISTIYSIPLFFLALPWSDGVRPDLNVWLFLLLDLVAILSGVGIGLFESRGPWPVESKRGPNYYYENNARAKGILGQFVVIPILFCYYRHITFTHTTTGEDTYFKYANYFVGFANLYFWKVHSFIGEPEEEEGLKGQEGKDPVVGMENGRTNGKISPKSGHGK